MTASTSRGRPAIALITALVAGLAATACGQGPQGPTTAPTAPACAVGVSFIDGGPDAQLTGTGFPPDQPATLTITGPPEGSDPLILDQSTNPALRSDIRGVVEFVLRPERDNIGIAQIDLVAGRCSASTTIELPEAMFPPACPAGKPVASGGPAADAYAALVLADAPIGYWRFEEAAGPFAVASAGQDGAIQGDGPFGQAGPVTGSRALGLDGDGDWVNIVDIELAADFTIEGWIYFCDNEIWSDDGLVSQDGDFGPNINFFDARPRFWSGDTAIGDVVWTDEPVEHARWYHIALTRFGPNVTLYVSGQSVMTAAYAPALPVGALGSSGTGTTAGQIDEIAIYDYRLTPEQLAARVAAAS